MILITGASGRVGGRAAELLARGRHRLRLMTRNTETAPKLQNAEIVRGDYADPSSLKKAFEGVTTALVVSGSGEPGKRARQHRNAFEAAAQAHVGHVVYLSLQGAAPESKYPYNRDHFESEQYLAESGIPWTVLRDSFYMDMFVQKFDADSVVRGPAGQGRGAFLSREDAARTVAAVLPDPPGGIHDVTGPESLTVAGVAARLSRIVGRELRYENEPPGSMRERLRGKIQPAWRVDLEVGWYEAIAAGELEGISDTVRRFTGNPALNFEEYFGAFPDVLRPLLPQHSQKPG